jgi:archaellum component FlaC
MGVRVREHNDRIGRYEDKVDTMARIIGTLKQRVETLEERLRQAESILKLIHYESNPAYLEGLKNKYEEMYGDKNE